MKPDPAGANHPALSAAPTLASSSGIIVETDVPARLDRLPWGRFHTLVVLALGITWILDGLEVTIVGSLAGALKESPSLRFSNLEVGLASSAYLAGASVGAIFFGWLTDRLGRRRLFFMTLAVYLLATAATAFSWSFLSFAVFRFLTGAGIGGEYAAINSAIQELVPARVRGWTDLVINGSFWVGAAAGALASIWLLNASWAAADLGWRLAFGIGAVLSLFILLLRSWLPESPRWLITHGQAEAAEAIVASIESRFRTEGHRLAGGPFPKLRLQPRSHTPLAEVVSTLITMHGRRTLVGLALMSAQAFFYNAIFFTYALVLTDFYAIPSADVGWYILPFAVGNFSGPVLLGRLFDTWGRRQMLGLSYAASGVLLLATAAMFTAEVLDVRALTVCWSVIFFFASAAASAAYLTVSEIFPVEVRAMAIACFYTFGTAVGGVAGPWLMGLLIDTQSRVSVSAGYAFGAVLMLVAAGVAVKWAIPAERRSLEEVAEPLTLLEQNR